MRKRYTFYLSFGCLLIAFVSTIHAADQPNLIGPSAAGAGKYIPQQWSVVSGAVVNPSDQDKEFSAGMRFENTPGVQFDRRVWVPAKSKRTFWLPVYPAAANQGERNLAIQGELTPADSGGTIDTTQGQLRIATVKVMTGVFEDPDDLLELDTVAAMRTAAQLKHYMAYMVDYKFPQVPEGWNALHSLMVCRDDISLSASQMQALRQWIFSGGKLWLMMEQADPAFMPELLGDAWKVEIIDRVAMTDFEIISDADSEKRSFDYPVEMIRVIAPDAKVIHRINNWPASMTIKYGLGEVLVTTVESEAWIDGAGETTQATASLAHLSKDFFKKTVQPVVSEETAKAMILSQISTVGAAMLGVVILLGVVLLIVASVVCLKTGQTRQLKWVIPLVVIATLVSLYVVKAGQGASGQGATMAGLQLIYTSANLDHALVVSQVGMDSAGDFKATQGGIAIPVSLNDKPATGNITWTDRGQWSITDAAASGVACYKTQSFMPLTQPITLTLPESGATEGRLVLEGFAGASDMLLVTPSGNYSATMEAGGALKVASTVTDASKFVSKNAIPAVAQRRQQVVKEIAEQIAVSGNSAMLVWVDPMDTAMNTDPAATSQVDALLILNVN